MYYPIKKEKQIMINLVMRHLRAQVAEADFQILIFLVPFLIFLDQIFLMIFLKDLVEPEEEGEEEHLTTEVKI